MSWGGVGEEQTEVDASNILGPDYYGPPQITAIIIVIPSVPIVQSDLGLEGPQRHGWMVNYT